MNHLRIITILFICVWATSLFAQESTLSFNRDIRPILSDKCFHCHGPDEHARKADLRLDRKDDALNVIEPGSIEDSDLIHRIINDDPDSLMPPAGDNKPLSDNEIAKLKQWVAEGANWSEFWAYVPPSRHELPSIPLEVDQQNWIDQFVIARLKRHSLELSPSADKPTLLRRLYFDLIGLPPTPAQVEAYLADTSKNATTKVIDKLLASKHFGERLAIYWLDLVRYADTVGYHGDQPHNISPYRDWVINAFNENMPFDQFTREQLAGDLLPNSTESQRVASGYNRLLQTTHEGGLQPDEYSAIYAADRVRNVSLVWMGATVGCAQCHDHKYDPYTSKDFYAMSAFFADIDDEKHFKVGTNSLPTKRPPEILIIEEQHRPELTEAQIAVSDQSNRLSQLKKQLSKLNSELKAQKEQAIPVSAVLNTQIEALKTEVATNEKSLIQTKRRLSKIESMGAWTMISQPLKTPRVTRVLARGNWMDASGEVVEPAIPEFMGRIKTDKRATRLDLANWIMDPSEGVGQLTARVIANRFWYLLMGVGISRSLDDFGGQGEAPAFPELLDNLAIEFVENNWDTKQLIRSIVSSKTYQQASAPAVEIQDIDPYNQLFSHQSRYRLPAEIIRDNALSISGLLNLKTIGGKSIKPAQPTNYYQHLNFPPREYAPDKSDSQWRRSVYIHWQRMFLHPSLKAFDAPSREECTASRPKSNTPSAALALLNDPIFVESARVFAARVIEESDSTEFDTRLSHAFQLALSRKPSTEEIKILERLFGESLVEFQANKKATSDILAIGNAPTPDAETSHTNQSELAAWTTVARAILNMNETITRN